MERFLIICVAASLTIILSICHPTKAANCALRNPDRQIYEMFPAATSYRSVVASVNNKVRPAIETALGSKLSLNDLGKHTLYIVLNDGAPLGFCHARSEIGKSGSIELAWALDLDLKIADFRLQRARDRHRETIKTRAFRDKLLGKDAHCLLSFLKNANTAIDVSALQVPPEAASIAHTVVLCGAKMRFITEIAFGGAVLKARLLGNVYRLFPATQRVTKIKVSFDDAVVVEVKQFTGAEPNQLDQASITVLRSVGNNEETKGVLVFSQWRAHTANPEIWWAVSPDGVILNTVVVGKVTEEDMKQFHDLCGKALHEIPTLKNETTAPPNKCAVEVLSVLKVHAIGK